MKISHLIIATAFFLHPSTYAHLSEESPDSRDTETATPASLFPCQVDEAEKPPKIIIHGENHHLPAHMEKKDALVTRAAKGEIVLGLEGALGRLQGNVATEYSVGWLSGASLVYGIDSAIPYGLTALIHTYRNSETNIKEHGRKNDLISRLVMESLKHQGPGQFQIGNKYASESWKKLRDGERFEDGSLEEIAKVFDQLQKAGTDTEKANQILSKLPRNHPYHTEHEKVFGLFARWARAYTKLLEAEYASSAMLPEGFTEMVDSALKKPSEGNQGASEKAYFALVLDWRNKFMASEIAKLYCKSLEEGKDLHVVVGDKHRKGLIKILTGDPKANKLAISGESW